MLDGEDPGEDDGNTVLSSISVNTNPSPGSCNSSVVTVQSVDTLVEEGDTDGNSTVQMFLKVRTTVESVMIISFYCIGGF